MTIAIPAHRQQTQARPIPTGTYFGPSDAGYIYEPYVDDKFPIMPVAATATACLASGRGNDDVIQARIIWTLK